MYAPPISLHKTSACATVRQHIFIPNSCYQCIVLSIILMVAQWQFYAMYVHDSKEGHCLVQTYFSQKNIPINAEKMLKKSFTSKSFLYQEVSNCATMNVVLFGEIWSCFFLNLFSYLLLLVSILALLHTVEF